MLYYEKIFPFMHQLERVPISTNASPSTQAETQRQLLLKKKKKK